MPYAVRCQVSGRPQPSARRPGLSRSRVTTAAIELVDRDGLDALTMRRLGAELGVEAMSLYHHVPSKDALLDAITEEVVAGMEIPPEDTEWEAALRALAGELRRVVLAHPRLAALVATRPLSSSAALAPVEATLAALRRGGLSDEEIVSSFWAFTSYLTGVLLSEAAAMTDARGAVAGPGQAAAAGLPAGDFPELTALGPALAALDWKREFDRGVDLLLAGLGAERGRD